MGTVHTFLKARFFLLCSRPLLSKSGDTAIVFGAGRPQTGVLILPSDIAKDFSKEELMDKVWPVIEHANADAPTHSRILPEMVEFLP